MLKFKRVSNSNGLWPELLGQWDKQCSQFEENFEDYASGTVSILRPLAEQAQTPSSGVYAVCNDSEYLGICQLNVTFIKGYPAQVLRVRHILFSPKFDYDDSLDIEDYADMLTSVFVGVLNSSDGEMAAPDIKFHFRSPAELQFFDKFKAALGEAKIFKEVAMKGSWLYIKK